jgi:hypothetical protein
VALHRSAVIPRDADNSAAIVEITLSIDDDRFNNDKKAPPPPSLIALMPQEHTYNSAALNSKANAFGGSVAVKMVTIGYTDRRRGQTYYLSRDNDTASFERQLSGEAGKILFGWEFRPVRGRKSVAPGTRQIFAVISIPEEDSFRKIAANGRPIRMKAEIKAYWRKYDQGTLTTANNREIRPESKIAHVFSLGHA